MEKAQQTIEIPCVEICAVIREDLSNPGFILQNAKTLLNSPQR